MNEPLHVASLDAFVFRAPLETPVQTSFGLMHDRPMLLVRAVDRDGATGWGEIWCNFPAVGAEHRARLLTSILRPLLTARPYASPADAFQHMTLATEVMAIQCAEPGPFAQAIAGVDIALHDLAARRAGQPLWRYLGGRGPRVEVYASGLNPTSPETLASEKQREGHRSFKLKIGFGRDRDLANLAALRDSLGAMHVSWSTPIKPGRSIRRWPWHPRSSASPSAGSRSPFARTVPGATGSASRKQREFRLRPART